MRSKKILLRILRIGVIAFLGVCLVLSLVQNYFVFPGAATQGTKDSIVTPGLSEELVHLTTANGVPVAAIFDRALASDGGALADTSHCPTVIFFYGNGMCMADLDNERRHLRRLGANVIVPDYVGYGMSGGKPSERGVYQTAEAAYQYILSRNDIDKSRLVPMGWSLGGAAAVELAHQHQVAGLITVSAFTSLRDMAHHLAPLLPTSLIVRYRFDNEQKLRDIHCPILIIHGRRDHIVPFEMSDRLTAAAGNNAIHFPIDAADHNDIFDQGGAAMYERIGSFLDQR